MIEISMPRHLAEVREREGYAAILAVQAVAGLNPNPILLTTTESSPVRHVQRTIDRLWCNVVPVAIFWTADKRVAQIIKEQARRLLGEAHLRGDWFAATTDQIGRAVAAAAAPQRYPVWEHQQMIRHLEELERP